MKTDDEMITEVDSRLRDMRIMETHTWEKYDATGETRFMSVLEHVGKARIELAFAKQLIANANLTGKQKPEKEVTNVQ